MDLSSDSPKWKLSDHTTRPHNESLYFALNLLFLPTVDKENLRVDVEESSPLLVMAVKSNESSLVSKP